jgi:hypothetical protein
LILNIVIFQFFLTGYLECQFGNFAAAGNITNCTKVSSASKGDIDVKFNATELAPQIVFIGIAAVPPNTKVELTCTGVPSPGGAKTVSPYIDC